MKRDMDLIRTIFFAVEESPCGFQPQPEKFGVDSATFGMHAVLLEEAGLIEASIPEVCGGPRECIWIERLTWKGHEFLDNVRDDTVWAEVRSKGTDLSFQLVLQLAIAFGMRKLGLS